MNTRNGRERSSDSSKEVCRPELVAVHAPTAGMEATMRMGLIALLVLQASCRALAHDHPPGIDGEFLNTLERPDNHNNPSRNSPGSTHNALLCCTDQDAVKVRYRVEREGGQYPQDIWFVWFKDIWTKVDEEKISPEYAPSGQAYIFVLGNSIQCFVRPKGHH
jgi:hypothetical protein